MDEMDKEPSSQRMEKQPENVHEIPPMSEEARQRLDNAIQAINQFVEAMKAMGVQISDSEAVRMLKKHIQDLEKSKSPNN